jgi:predicted small lipoprotein YifL
MKKVLMMIMLAAFVSPMVGCKEKGPLEEAGEKVDEAAEDAGRAVKDATD